MDDDLRFRIRDGKDTDVRAFFPSSAALQNARDLVVVASQKKILYSFAIPRGDNDDNFIYPFRMFKEFYNMLQKCAARNLRKLLEASSLCVKTLSRAGGEDSTGWIL